ncbi:protein of unknown function [Hyphomicrobium sp. MC1]|nr:protein of unknown function [Hyphomicrobium sp. MC1]
MSVATDSAIRCIPVDEKTELTFASGNLFAWKTIARSIDAFQANRACGRNSPRASKTGR